MGTRAGLEYPVGDPGGLSAAAARLSALATVLAAEAGRVARAGTVSGWQGGSAQVFAAAAGQLARPLVTGAGALRRASRSVEDLAELIEQAQTLIGRWADEIEDAERDADLARSALLAATVPAGAGPLTDSWDLGRQRDAQQRYDRAAGRLTELRARYQPKARQLCEEIERADRGTQAAVLAAAGAAPAGGAGVPGAPKVPADVRTFAPVWMFSPDETYLPADPRQFRDIDQFRQSEEWRRFLRGQGAGAPIFYRERDFGGGEKVIEYWFYRRWNDFRDLGIRGASSHPDDSEGIAVRIRDGRPVQVGYTQHEHGCSLPFEEAPRRGGHPVSHPGDGSGANSPFRGAADNRIRVPVLGLDANPYEDLHGPAPGERTPPRNIVHGEDNAHPYRGDDWRIIDPGGNRVPDNASNSSKFRPGSPVWHEECEPLRPRE